MRINPANVTIVFIRKYKLDHLRAIRWHGMGVKLGAEVKYLEITLEQKLHWQTHIGNVFRKTTRALMTCKFVAVNK